MKGKFSWLLLALITGVLILTIGWTLRTASRQGQNMQHGSSFLSDAHGTRALYLLLVETGHETTRLDLPAPPTMGTLITVNPARTDTLSEHRLLDWIEKGGRLVLVDSTNNANLNGFWAQFEKNKRQLLREALGLRLEEKDGDNSGFWRRLPAGAKALRGTPNRPVIATFKYGSGEVVAVADPSLLSNASVGSELDTILNLVLERKGPIYFDEYRHGSKATTGLAYVVYRYGLVQTMFAAVLLLAMIAWRTTPREAEFIAGTELFQGEVRDSMVEARTSLYACTLKSTEMLEMLENDFRLSMSRSIGNRGALSWKDLRARLDDRKPGLTTRLDTILADLERQKSDPPNRAEALLPLARNMFTFVEELG